MTAKTILFIFVLTCFSGRAQDNACLTEVLTYENAMGKKNDSIPSGKTLLFGYKIIAHNQYDEITESSVKVYFNGENLNMFSEQASIYRNDREAVMVLPEQKVLVINSTTRELNRTRVSDDFLEMRKEFLKSCRVAECVTLFGQHKKLVLEALGKTGGALNIRKITYEYDTDRKTILNIKTEYDDDYKLKSLMIIYRPTEVLDSYSFSAINELLNDKKGKLLSKYKDYEIIDNREQVTVGKKKH